MVFGVYEVYQHPKENRNTLTATALSGTFGITNLRPADGQSRYLNSKGTGCFAATDKHFGSSDCRDENSSYPTPVGERDPQGASYGSTGTATLHDVCPFLVGGWKGCCRKPENTFMCPKLGKANYPKTAYDTSSTCSTINMSCKYPLNIIPDKEPDASNTAQQLINYYGSRQVQSSDLNKIMSNWCMEPVTTCVIDSYGGKEQKSCPRMLSTGNDGKVCKKWATYDSVTKKAADEIMSQYCLTTANAAKPECDCLAADNIKSRLNDTYETLITGGLPQQNSPCWFTPCRTVGKEMTYRFVTSEMYDKSNCDPPKCVNISINKGTITGKINQSVTCEGNFGPTWGCNAEGVCVKDPTGDFTALSACQRAKCVPQKFKCNTDKQCVRAPDGKHAAKSDCESVCKVTPPPTPPPKPTASKWDCKDNKCVQSKTGKYTTEKDCQNTCKAPVLKWDCNDKKCVQSKTGKYDTSAACQKDCETPAPTPAPDDPSWVQKNKYLVIGLAIGIIILLMLIIMAAS
jgi:hypothetical protein